MTHCLLSVGTPLDLIASETLRWKCQEPVLLLGKQRFANVDIRIRAQGGGHVSQIYGAGLGTVPSFLSTCLLVHVMMHVAGFFHACFSYVPLLTSPMVLQLSDKPLPRV